MIYFYIYFILFILIGKIVDALIVDNKCQTGKFALQDENGLIFPCQRGCPYPFFCEKNISSSSSFCCPNVTEILNPTVIEKIEANIEIQNKFVDRKSIEFQMDDSDDFKRSFQCERYPYKENCNNSSLEVQPQVKWFFNIQSLSCELYPFGICEEESIDQQFTLKTKQECEEKCDVAKVVVSIQNLKNHENSVEEFRFLDSLNDAETPSSIIGELAIEDEKVELKHIRGRPYHIEPPTDLIHLIHLPSDHPHQFIQTSTNNYDEETNENGQIVTSDILKILENSTNFQLIDDNEGSGISENDEPDLLSEIKENQQIIEDFPSLNKSDENQRFYEKNKAAVICFKSDYRQFCQKGKPSQFVYRWELIDNECQSFPYGYCLYEDNIAHPRTKLECEKYCK